MSSKSSRAFLVISSIVLALLVALSAWVYIDDNHPLRPYLKLEANSEETMNEPSNNNPENNKITNENDMNEPDPDPEPEPDKIVSLSIAAAGDIMFHNSQITSNFINKDTGKYDFSSFFTDVAPIIQAADLAIANFETTTAGTAQPYSGYPVFNTPDEAIGNIKDAGIDVLVTANNHSLDTGIEGLRRTARMMKEYQMDSVGTYDEPSDVRFLMKEVNDLKVAILAYTESTNGLGDQYDPDTLYSMINMMEKEQIKKDIATAKEADADLIIAFMHWGVEYASEPSDIQKEYAQLLADEGVHIILGSHPHVIQKSEFIKTNDFNTFVIYSLGNFISNQRRETLGDDFARTEDGVIVQLEVEKNITQDTLKIRSINYVPTWVHRTGDNGIYDYRILPVEASLSDQSFQKVHGKLQQSYQATTSKLEAAIPVN